MKPPTRCIQFTLTLALMLGVSTSSPAQNRFELTENDVVVFVGGTNMVHLQQAGYLEAMLTRDFAAARPKFRDFAWETDTVFRQGTVIERWRETAHFDDLGGLGNLHGQLKRVGATVVIAQFGRLESLAGQEKLADFTNAYKKLIEEFQRQARLVVLVTPTPFEKPPSSLIPDLSQRNADLVLYVEATSKIAEKRGLVFVDLFSKAKPRLTENGMHIKAEAQAHVAHEIMRQFHSRGSLREPNALIAERSRTELERLRHAVIEKHRLWYDYWRPANWKLIYGDDAKRQFTRGGTDYIPFQEEWRKLIPLIARAEERVWTIAAGGDDPGDGRPEPEKLHANSNADVEKELDAFSTSDDLQVNLFASEREGLTSPLAIRWDPAGRMYVTVTTTYPHVFPGDLPNDKIILLEDTDGDGQADKSTVFADGLNIPTGIEWGDGGVYVGQNTEILFLKDTDGDNKADQREVVLGGFGNGDSHQTINSFIWSPGGELYFGHGDGCESRVETPWGASNLFNAGFYHFRPRRLQLVPFLEGHMGPGNPWGVAFDEWGQIFNVDGAGGVNWLSPGQVSTTHVRKFSKIGEPGGYCGIGYLDGRHLPESMRGDFVVGDFKANRIKRFSVEDRGSGFSLDWKEPILQSRHRNFRPVDVKMGPDGAIYVVDWYNPITCHQDDAYRDPTRDKAHGRIWRVSSKAEPMQPPNLQAASIDDVLDALKSPEHWTRYQAKRALTVRDSAVVATALNEWVRLLDPKEPQYEHRLYEALGAYATIEVVEPNLLVRLLRAQNPRARAYATRIVGRWHDRLNQPLDLLAERIADKHPQVRMEAVVACSAIPSARSMSVAARVVDQPSDEWIDYAFKQTVHGLKAWWMPAFKRGDLPFERPSHLAAVLNEAGGRDALDSLKKLVDSNDLTAESKTSAIAAILAVGGAEELQAYGLDPNRFTRSGEYDARSHAALLRRLVEVAQFRDVQPSGDLAASLNPLIENPNPELQANALTLAGIWRVDKTLDNMLSAARNESLAANVRAAAFQAMVEMELPESGKVLASYATTPNPTAVRSAAIQSLTAVDMAAAASQAAALFAAEDLKTLEAAPTLIAFLNRSGGAEALAAALKTKGLKPASAKELLRSLFSTGRSDQVLLGAINQALGTSAQPPAYSAEYVKQLVSDASKQGESQRGAVLFKSMACNSCHKVSGAGGIVGPDLTAIGTTLAPDRIVEELLWPNRQIKEGFSVLQVITNDGKIHQGYERKTRESQESGDLVIQDPTTNKLVTIKKEQIEEKRVASSPMPTGLTALLSRPQLVDLIQYLSELGRIK
jgi:putative heme-binding domain-containing protein